MTTQTKPDATGLDALDPAEHSARDARYFRAIVAARESVSTAEAGLQMAVQEARLAGESWTVIGAALGVTKQAAQQRFKNGAS